MALIFGEIMRWSQVTQLLHVLTMLIDSYENTLSIQFGHTRPRILHAKDYVNKYCYRF